ncbi:hypothetical protein T492DRAFT_891746 [Pavlovales sp. CCMP2436]|nr:hypothetical protein T492DRAFT_891746 [Pavlovales sp. CCMP2436]
MFPGGGKAYMRIPDITFHTGWSVGRVVLSTALPVDDTSFKIVMVGTDGDPVSMADTPISWQFNIVFIKEGVLVGAGQYIFARNGSLGVVTLLNPISESDLFNTGVVPTPVLVTTCELSDSWLTVEAFAKVGSYPEAPSEDTFTAFTRIPDMTFHTGWSIGRVVLSTVLPVDDTSFKIVLAGVDGVPMGMADTPVDWQFNIMLVKAGKIVGAGLYNFARVGASGVSVEEVLGFLGMGTPSRRALAFAALATSVSYALKTPACFFTEEGAIKGFHPDPESAVEPESKTQLHFLVVPLLAGAVGYALL